MVANNDDRSNHTNEWTELSEQEVRLARELRDLSHGMHPDQKFAASLSDRLLRQIPAEPAQDTRLRRFLGIPVPVLWSTLQKAGQVGFGLAALAAIVVFVIMSMRVRPVNMALPVLESASPTPLQPTKTPTPSATPTRLAPGQPLLTPRAGLAMGTGILPAATQVVTGTPPPTETFIPCNRAEYVMDLTIPDKSKFISGAKLFKIWRLKNTGSCTWNTGYAVVFAGGEAMGGKSVRLPHAVAPGQKIDLRVDLIAPKNPGFYRGQWMLQSPDGPFGLGQNARAPFFVEIEVVQAAHGPIFDLAANYCAAEWSNGSRSLPCPGKDGDGNGYILYLPAPVIESAHENEPALLTRPENVRDGVISGIFPAFEVQRGDHFIADIGCMADNPKCNVIFKLQYRIGNGPVKTLDTWEEVYDGQTTRINVNLGALDGKSIQLILTVHTNGVPRDDAAFWLVPQVVR